jgi:hypothetical protein
MAIFLYLAAHWTLVLAVVLGVVGLGAAAFFLKNWKFAVAAIVLAIAGFLYQGAVTHGIQLQMARDAAIKVALLNGRLEAINKIAAQDADLARANAQRISELESLANDTPKNDGACLDLDAVNRLRNIK